MRMKRNISFTRTTEGTRTSGAEGEKKEWRGSFGATGGRTTNRFIPGIGFPRKVGRRRNKGETKRAYLTLKGWTTHLDTLE